VCVCVRARLGHDMLVCLFYYCSCYNLVVYILVGILHVTLYALGTKLNWTLIFVLIRAFYNLQVYASNLKSSGG
jgi:hypothetical protein